MKKILSILICAVLLTSFASSPLKVSANTAQNEQLIQLLMQMITMLQAQLAALTNPSDNKGGVQVKYPNGGEEFPSFKGAFVAKWESSGARVDLYLSSPDDVRYKSLGKNLTGGSYEVQLDESLLQKDVNRYKLQACISGTSDCDSSDNTFSFVSKNVSNNYTDTKMTFFDGKESLVGKQTYAIGDSVTWTVRIENNPTKNRICLGLTQDDINFVQFPTGQNECTIINSNEYVPFHGIIPSYGMNSGRYHLRAELYDIDAWNGGYGFPRATGYSSDFKIVAPTISARLIVTTPVRNDSDNSAFITASIGGSSKNKSVSYWTLSIGCQAGVTMPGKYEQEMCGTSLTLKTSDMFDPTSDYLLLTAGAVNNSVMPAIVALTLVAYDSNGNKMGGDREEVVLSALKQTGVPSISYITPTSASAGDTVRVYGSNFNENTYISIDGIFGNPIWPDNAPTSGTGIFTFTVPGNLSVGSHTVSVLEKGSSFTSNTVRNSVNLTVTSPASSAPTVSLSVTPTTLSPGQQATVTWSSTNAVFCTFTSFGDWAQDGAPLSGSATVGILASETIVLSCQNANGQSSHISAPIIVTSSPSITSLSPTSGPTGTRVTISATGLVTSGSNEVYFDGKLIEAQLNNNPNLGAISFAVPSYFPQNCISGLACTQSLFLVNPGVHLISIKNQNGTSNSMSFTVSGGMMYGDPQQTFSSSLTTPLCLSFSTNMHRGAESSNVTKLQSFLIQKGYLNETPTGFYGDKTIQAVKTYQASKSLPQTGMVYDFTRAVIKGETCN